MARVVGALLVGLLLPLAIAAPARAAGTGILDLATRSCVAHHESTVLRVGPIAEPSGQCSAGPADVRIALADGSLVGVSVGEKGLRYVVLPVGRAVVIDPGSGRSAGVSIVAGRHSAVTVTKYGPISAGGAVPPQNPTPVIPQPPDTTIRPAPAPARTTSAAPAGPGFASSSSSRPLADAANSDSGPSVALIGWLVGGFVLVLLAGGVVVARSGRRRRG